MKFKILLGAALIVITVVTTVVMVNESNTDNKSNVVEDVLSIPVSETKTLDNSPVWLTYTNDVHGITFEYPAEWSYTQTKTARTNALGVEGLDVTFFKAGTNAQVFQVMVTPSQYEYRGEDMGDRSRFSKFTTAEVCKGLTLCDPVSVLNGRGAVAHRIAGPIDGGGSIGFAKYAFVEHSDHQYSGIEFFGAQIDSCRYGANNWKACYGPGAVGDSPYTHENALVYQQYMASKIQNGLISEDAQKNVAILDHMVNSLQLSQ